MPGKSPKRLEEIKHQFKFFFAVIPGILFGCALLGLVGLILMKRSDKTGWKWRKDRASVTRRVRENFGSEDLKRLDRQRMQKKGWTVGANLEVEMGHMPGGIPVARDTIQAQSGPALTVSRTPRTGTGNKNEAVLPPVYSPSPEQPTLMIPPPVYTPNPKEGETVITRWRRD